jgi:hypothetical protein
MAVSQVLTGRTSRAHGARVARPSLADKLHGILTFALYHRHWPDLARPTTLSEHLLRLKLSDELCDPLRLTVTDKEHVKRYVAAVCGEGFNVPTLAVLRRPEEVEDFAFPAPCIIKPTHSSGRRIVRRTADEAVDRAQIRRWFRHNLHRRTREANYRDLNPKVIVEELLLFDGRLPDDYKIYCFAGRARLFHVMPNRLTHPISGCIYSEDWQRLPFTIKGPASPDMPRPANLDAIIDAAERLAAPFSYMRVDLYSDGRRIYVGELTSVPAGAHLTFDPPSADALAGRLFESSDLDTAELFAPLAAARRPG